MPRIIRLVTDEVFGAQFDISNLFFVYDDRDDSLGTTQNWQETLQMFLGSSIATVDVVDPEHG